MGEALYPDRQWKHLAQIWESYYPLDGLEDTKRRLLENLQSMIPAFVSLLVNHRPRALAGQSIREVLVDPQRQPENLRKQCKVWKAGRLDLRREPPSRAMAILGQAHADGLISPERESQVLSKLLTYWALRSTLDAGEICTQQAISQPLALTA
jgi:hypothetical protein